MTTKAANLKNLAAILEAIGIKAMKHDTALLAEHNKWEDAWNNKKFPLPPEPKVIQNNIQPSDWPGQSPSIGQNP